MHTSQMCIRFLTFFLSFLLIQEKDVQVGREDVEYWVPVHDFKSNVVWSGSEERSRDSHQVAL